jgi:hypothetical protein
MEVKLNTCAGTETTWQLQTTFYILTQHQQEVHTGQNYPCRECEYQAKNINSLTQHHYLILSLLYKTTTYDFYIVQGYKGTTQ